MFDVTADEIAQLCDTDLRELIGRLCEAELTSRGLCSVSVTWGGSQTASDGGLDVRVALPASTEIEGFIPRFSTGFQVKAPDMPRSDILTEMRPAGAIRPVIQELADEGGAYIIISSHGSTSDSALRNRRNALREALSGISNADRLHTDFYDRTRIATWARGYPGLVTWVKEKVGRSLSGWRPYGPWSGSAEGIEAEYLLDDKLRLHLGRHRDRPAQPVIEAIDELRDELAKPRKLVRLVGLSGVGKTRFVQALFDDRVGLRPLAPSLAVYTNLSDNPNPQPIGLASDLIANRTRAILIVDNCPPDLHRRLSDLCAATGSTVSILTVEYDVRDDQPEGTQVVTLDTSSPELIGKLVARRYPHISEVDTRTIAEVSGGNARIAIAIAETVGHSETIAGLSDEELFQRLFRQRHDSNDALLIAAEVCSLVYSFEGETLTGSEAELPRLASLAEQTPQEFYRHVRELLRRDLVQQRSVWRAVLPHAVANQLASRALDEIPYDLIAAQFFSDGTKRLAQSFSRRLSFLHEHPKAIALARQWLAPNGLLGEVTSLSELGRVMFDNVAPVLPEEALAVLERARVATPDKALKTWHRHRELLHSLAYDPTLFERSTSLLARVATESTDDREAKEASDTFAALFKLYLSGTHATAEQRLNVIEQLLRSSERKRNKLGIVTLSEFMEGQYFTSVHHFQFGARPRDHGSRPKSHSEVQHWYRSALSLIERLVVEERTLETDLQELFGRTFRDLWTFEHIYDELEHLSLRIAENGFWRDGWLACRYTMHLDKGQLTPESYLRLTALEAKLRPTNLKEQTQAIVVGDRIRGLDLEDLEVDDETARERLGKAARELGEMVANDEATFAEVIPELLQGGNRTWAFGRGLASASQDRHATWTKLVESLAQVAPERRNLHVLMGYLGELWEQDRPLAQSLLDGALDQPILTTFLPSLHAAVDLDEQGVERLKQGLHSGKVPIGAYQSLAYGRTTDRLAGKTLKNLLLLIARQTDGLNVALEILHMRLFSDRSERREYAPELIEAGRILLKKVVLRNVSHRDDRVLAEIVGACLAEPEAAPIAAEIARRLKQAVILDETQTRDNDDLIIALLRLQPIAVLNTLLSGRKAKIVGAKLFDRLFDHRVNPADAISCEALVDWCDQDKDVRYTLAASIVSFARKAGDNELRTWSEQARVLLEHAPDAKKVLSVFIKRFWPRGWSGSRASLVEANTRLLDSPEVADRVELLPFITEAKNHLALEIAEERKRETTRYREQDERFE